MVLIDAPAEQVYAGQAAAEELIRQAGTPDLAGNAVDRDIRTD
jgi:hypothetical protein